MQVPESGLIAEAANSIRDFMVRSATQHRICPEGFYITSDGNTTGGPRCEKTSILRMKKPKFATDEDAVLLVAKNIKQIFGKQLTETCHCGPEESIYKNALNTLMLEFNPDLRKLFSNKLYKAQELITKIGLGHVIRTEDWPDDSDYPPPFARIFHFGQQNEESTNFGIGVHPFLLIFYVSMSSGAVLHPKVSSDWAKTILSKILSMAPQAATPGNLSLVRSYDVNTTVHQRVVVPKKERCHHFIRPTEDFNFINTGVCTYVKAMRQFMPEDCLHCGALFRFGELFKCDVMQLPGNDLHVLYEIMANTYYAIYRASDSAYGTLFVNSAEKKVYACLKHPEEEVMEVEWTMDNWQENLREMDCIIPPMVWRSGAAVCVRSRDEKKVACLVYDEEYSSNFNPETCTYDYVTADDSSSTSWNFIHVYQNLIPVGTQLYLIMDSGTGAKIRDRLSTQDRNKPLLAVRLNVPHITKPINGKLYVSCTKRSILAKSDTSDLGSVTFPVDPWELLMEPGEGQTFAQWITHRGGPTR